MLEQQTTDYTVDSINNLTAGRAAADICTNSESLNLGLLFADEPSQCVNYVDCKTRQDILGLIPMDKIHCG